MILPGRWPTRWALYRLWLRHAYTFQWAHKPLCHRFGEDVIRIGRVWLCRSCTLVYAAVLVVGLWCVSTGGPPEAASVPLLAGLVATTVLLSLPWWYKRWPRPVRDLLRFALGATIALDGWLLLTGDWLPGLLAAVVLAAFWKLYRVLRGRRKRTACDGCAELDGERICSGFARQAEHVRRYEIAATEWLMEKGGVEPGGVRGDG